MTTATKPRTFRNRELEWSLCSQSFPDFLERVRIQEPPVPGDASSGGIIQFERWPHLMELAAVLPVTRLLGLLKARQDGATWLTAAYLDWLANYRAGTDGLLLSKNESDSQSFLAKVATVHRLFPSHLKVPLAADPTSERLRFQNGSLLTAMASTEQAGRSRTYSVVVQDEADFHPYLAENYGAVKPTIDAGGQLIQVSTANKRKMGSLFKGIILGAPGNGWTKRFWGWRLRPGRDQAWYDRTRAEAPAASGMSPDLYMEENYPDSEAEALAPSRALAFFNPDATLAMLDDCREPMETRLGGLVRVWRKPVVAGKYVAGGDCAWGLKGSYSSLTVLDWATGEEMAEVYGRPDQDEYAQRIYDLCTLYNRAYVGIEENGEGKNVVRKLRDLGYGPRMYCRTPDHADASYRSWLTDGTTRPILLGEYAEAIRNRSVVLRSKDAVDEHMNFIRDEAGRPGPAEGRYADRVFSTAIAWKMREYATFGASNGKPLKINWGWR